MINLELENERPNLKDLYSRKQAESLVGDIPENIEPALVLWFTTFYWRDEINKILDDYMRKHPGEIMRIRKKILATPAFDLDLNKWVDYNTALEIFPLSHQRLIEAKNTYDKLNVIRVQDVYDIIWYNIADMERYVNINPRENYYDISWAEAQKIEYDKEEMEQYLVETNKNQFAAWYTPKELAFVLGIPRRYLWNWMKEREEKGDMPTRRTLSRAYLYYVTEVHEWLENNEKVLWRYNNENWHSRWIHLAQNRVRGESFDDWITIRQAFRYIDYSRPTFHHQRRHNKWATFDYGGIIVYLKEDVKATVLRRLGEDKVWFPLESNDGTIYETEEEWVTAVKEW